MKHETNDTFDAFARGRASPIGPGICGEGPEGGIAFTISLPDGFDVERDHCPIVILMHGIFAWKEFIPMRCSEEFLATYGDAAELIVIEEENHTITRKRKEVVAATVGFFSEVFGR